MVEYWPAIVFGWPPVIATVGLSIVGIFRKKPRYLYIAAVIVFPFSAYLAATPRFQWIALLIPISMVVAAIAIRNDKIKLAWVSLLPFVGISGWVAFAVITQ